MKTAISIPDDTFSRVTERAAELGMSRSEFFAKAAKQYLEQLDSMSVTSQIDRVLAEAGEDDSWTAAVDMGRRRLTGESDW